MTPETRNKIRAAFLEGTLAVDSVVEGVVTRCSVSDVLRHHTPSKRQVRLTLGDNRFVNATEDHSVFALLDGEIVPVLAGTLLPGQGLVIVDKGLVTEMALAAIEEIPSEEYTYDLSVPGPENFVLANGILAHNSYSIGGVSLDIEKSSKYESLKQNAEGQFDKAIEQKARTVKFMRGLTQPRFGMGVRSAFGPAVARGVMSARAFLVFFLMILGTYSFPTAF